MNAARRRFVFHTPLLGAAGLALCRTLAARSSATSPNGSKLLVDADLPRTTPSMEIGQSLSLHTEHGEYAWPEPLRFSKVGRVVIPPHITKNAARFMVTGDVLDGDRRPVVCYGLKMVPGMPLEINIVAASPWLL